MGPDELALLAQGASGPDDDERRSTIRTLLLEAYGNLQRGRPRAARKALKKAQQTLRDFPDHQLTAATEMGLAQAALTLGRPKNALTQMQAGLQELTRFDLALSDPTQRARFVAAVEPLTRQALALAVNGRDPQTGLRLLEYRRTGKLSGLLQRHRPVVVTPEVSGLLDRLDEFREGHANDGTDTRSVERTIAPAWEDCHRLLADATSRLFAEAYDPTGIEIRQMVEALPASCAALILDRPDPAHPEQLVRAIAPGGDLERAELSHITLSEAALRLVELLTAGSETLQRIRRDLRPEDLTPLVEPLLGPLAETIGSGSGVTDLLVVPTGQLWAVPFAALPVAGRPGTSTLIEHVSITLTPSLRFHDIAARRPRRSGAGALSWRSPELGPGQNLDEHRALDVLGTGHVRATSPSAVRAALADADTLDILAIAGHGINEPGLAHGIWLDERKPLRAAELLEARLGRLVLLGACGAGFSPGTETTEPIGFSTLALCAGADAVIGPCLELADTEAAAGYLSALYRAVTEGGHPSRVHQEITSRWLEEGSNRARPVVEWAAVSVLGTVPEDSATHIGSS
jgi:hypothetical protein